ncbi:capsule biosynthesis protein CapG [Chryseobacterium sp. IHB B 17019]|jgi:acetyltransferase-like isoleucine patch superfamily enzyme|uniref:acyltransferase n=1 Tax=Chryseobacterium sp. IHB B 17019 TaxID=1721091 RepID=UPI00071FFD0C|nr:acyltransferase [Chryseobacterium sp. IHB B 17019]ALR31851.1 capsule biosynthesis protein CapG [Chryseobacterium sp. IHB B 17019]
MMIYKILNKLFTSFQDFQHAVYLKTCIQNGLKLGKNVVARNGVSFGSEPFLVEIGDDSRIGAGVTFVTHAGTTVNIRKLEGYEEVRNFGHIKVGKNCAIGSNSTILQNVEIGDNCILGANSVLSESMPEHTVYAGNPAKYVCEIEDYADVLKKTTVEYPLELEKDRKKLNQWLIKNLPVKFKTAR